MIELAVDLQLGPGGADAPTLVDLRRWVAAALEGRRGRAELTIRVVGEAEAGDLNRRYRGQDRPTNVLSFPFDAPPGIDPEDPIHDLLGDLVICADLVRREAREQGKEEGAHWAHLVVHGVLHLLDYDHLTDEQAAEMEGLETVILGGLGFPPPYGPDVEPAPFRRIPG
jgi:probable rRNA maturation factor